MSVTSSGGSRADGLPAGASELGTALGRFRASFIGVGLVSGLVNVLCLTGSLFMLEVYDRVIPSRSVPTLVGLSVLALALFVFQGALETLRSRILARIGVALDAALSGRVFDVLVRAPIRSEQPEGTMPVRDLDSVRAFLAGSGPCALFDLPWLPVYVAICFLFHPMIGVAALVGACVLALLTLCTEVATRRPARSATRHGAQRHILAETSRRNAEVIAALGMQARFNARWGAVNRDYMAAQTRVADVSAGFGTLSKLFRVALQSGVLALGAWLVIHNQATGGVIIASSILVSRALAPAELAIANWKSFVQARQSWARLTQALARHPADRVVHALPAPVASLAVENLFVAPPGAPRLVVQDVSFGLSAGQGLGIIGASASGKSSLVRALVGVWPAFRGAVRLDGAALDQWQGDALGRHLGFLPQEVELFAGTVAENISRFEPGADPALAIAAAKAAGVHELILRLPEGYDTQIGEGGAMLSAGQRQRLGLARALYRDPFLVVLDEPNSNLDGEGEAALTEAIQSVRRRGGICVVVAHRPSALSAVDTVLVMAGGRVQAIGPKDEIFKHVLRAPTAPVPAVAQDNAVRRLQASLQEIA
ncbi:type I secretion protein [Methylobacterium tarhaniae]|uniref:Type I secretion protein n=1 Tax=Methylobacterium tarhaniae TaxID=1187852 RepID=A0A0J6T651_9HYPH|nr:type I secretion system permease/ATPase [Methylobacterium tarhaniae]KMO42910.1 type I secretion protein [Methylobacterium tarhaniae]